MKKKVDILVLCDPAQDVCQFCTVKLFFAPMCDVCFTKANKASQCQNTPHNYSARLVNQKADKIIKKQVQKLITSVSTQYFVLLVVNISTYDYKWQ